MKHLTLILLVIGMAVQAFAGFSPKSESEIYNEGVDLLMDLKFKKAEKKFRSALEADASFGEAHNNLAYCLRKQGEENFSEALEHYNLAIELIPASPEPYMYRGVLMVQMGDKEKALEDHARLVEMKANDLAEELEWVISNHREKEPEQFFGVAGKIDQ